jgi:ABC-type nitrate/sulfonate/bicarbonate transport system ATPase subunit
MAVFSNASNQKECLREQSMSVHNGQALSITRLSKQFSISTGTVQALTDVNLRVEPGEFISIVGASGCGKSTLLRIIVGLDSESSGKILLGDWSLRKSGVDRGMVMCRVHMIQFIRLTFFATIVYLSKR